MTDAELLILCAIQEAGNQCADGRAAVAKVVLDRVRMHYDCDGTIAGAIEAHAQFSWTEYAMAGGVYRRVALDGPQELARIARLLAQAQADTLVWRAVASIVAEVMAGKYSSPLFDRLTPTTVLYDNLALTKPSWIAASRFVVKIQDHSFFEPIGARPSLTTLPAARPQSVAFGAAATRAALEA